MEWHDKVGDLVSLTVLTKVCWVTSWVCVCVRILAVVVITVASFVTVAVKGLVVVVVNFLVEDVNSFVV